MFVCRRTVGHPIRISGRRMLIQTQGKVKSFCIFLYMPSIYHSEQINIQTLPFKCLVLVRFFWVKLWCFFLDSFMNRNSEKQHRFQTEFLYKYKLVLSLLIILSIYIYIYIYIHHSRILVFIYVFKMPLLLTKAVYLTQIQQKTWICYFFENWKTRKAAFNIKSEKEWTQHIWTMFLFVLVHGLVHFFC